MGLLHTKRTEPMYDLNALANLASRLVESKQSLTKDKTFSLLMNILSGQEELTAHNAAKLMTFFLPRKPAKAKNKLKWASSLMTKAAAKAEVTINNLIHATGQHVISTDGFRMHGTAFTKASGRYSKDLKLLSEESTSVTRSIDRYLRVEGNIEKLSLDKNRVKQFPVDYYNVYDMKTNKSTPELAVTINGLRYNKKFIDEALAGIDTESEAFEVYQSVEYGNMDRLKSLVNPTGKYRHGFIRFEDENSFAVVMPIGA